MDTLLIILAILCTLGGVAGCILPILPGPPLNFLALLLMRWSGHAGFDSRFLWIWVAVTLIVSALDYLLPGYLARRFGGSKYAATGSTVGMIVGPAGRADRRGFRGRADRGTAVRPRRSPESRPGSDRFVRRISAEYRIETGGIARNGLLRDPGPVRIESVNS